MRVDGLLGDSTERRYGERAASYFQEMLRRIRLIDHQSLGDLLDDAVDAGRLNPEEKEDVMLTDMVLSGRREGREVYALTEVSAAVDREDMERAACRSSLLQKATGIPVLAAVAASAQPRRLSGRQERPGYGASSMARCTLRDHCPAPFRETQKGRSMGIPRPRATRRSSASGEAKAWSRRPFLTWSSPWATSWDNANGVPGPWCG